MTKFQLFNILDKDPEIYRSFNEQNPRYASIYRTTYSYNNYTIIYMENNWFHCSNLNCELKDINKAKLLESLALAKKFVNNKIKMKKQLQNQIELEKIKEDFK